MMKALAALGLFLMGPLGCAMSTERVDPALADKDEFCALEEALVCADCPDHCADYPRGICYNADWPCDPRPNQSQADACIRALRSEPCGEVYPAECRFLWCVYDSRIPEP